MSSGGRNILRCAVAVLLAVMGASTAALADAPPAADDTSANYAFGAWAGRQRLATAGITFDAYYVNNIAGNVSGGRRRGVTYADNIYLGATFDMEKLAGWRGARFTVSVINRDGKSLTEEYVGSQYNSQQVFGGQNIFLYGVYLDQRFARDRLSLKFGRFGASDDFNTSPIYGFYMNNGIDGDIRNVLFDTQFSAYPFATWAARVRFDPTDAADARIGVFQTSDRVFDSGRHGLDWSIRRGDGLFVIAQTGWSPTLSGKPGHYWIGGSYSTWNYPQFGTTETVDKSYGFYVHADQVVTQESPGSSAGLTVWAAAGNYPQENISIVPFQVNAGLIYTGLLTNRAADRAILGVIYGRFSRDYARSIEASGGGDPSHELVVEAAYRIQFRKYLYVQPDVQWISKPGGTGRIADAWVLGVQMGLSL